MVSYEGKYIEKIKGMGFGGFLGALHLLFGVRLISTALWVLAKQEIFPWWVMDLDLIRFSSEGRMNDYSGMC